MRYLAALLLVLPLLLTAAYAEGLDPEQYELFGAAEVDEAVPDAASEILGGAGVKDALEPSGLFEALWEGLKDKADELWREAASGAVRLVAVAALCAAGGALATDSVREYVTMAGCLAVAAIAFGETGEWINAAASVLEEMNSFARSLLPCLTAAAAAGGMATSAAARYAATSLFMDVLLTLSRTLLMPLAYALLALRTASAALGNGALDGAGKLVKWIAYTLTGVIMTAFTAYLSFSGAVTGAADAAAAKAAKTAISAALPVVGGIISDAAATLVAGAGILRGAVGALGAAVIAALCIVPFIGLSLRYILYKAAAGVASGFCDSRVAGLIGDVGSVFALVLGITGAGAAMLYISILSTLKAVGI